MSQENVDALLRGFEAVADAVSRGDFDAELEGIDPEVVFEPLRAPVSGGYAGREGIRRFLADTAESFDVFRFNHTDIRALGDDRVLATGTLHIRARRGGVETDVPTAGIATFREGLVIHWKDYGDRRTALEAAGLSE